MKDLIISVADAGQKEVMEALLPRIPVASGTRTFSYQVIKNPGNDPGSYNDSHELLRPFINQYQYALVVFDFEGCGADHRKSRQEIETEVENQLSINGWENRHSVIVIKPELENWMWVDNPHVQNAIGWEKEETLYTWARNNQLLTTGQNKPSRPKEAFELALRLSNTPRSSSIYKKIAASVSYKNCEDPAFIKLIETLKQWFK